MNKILLTITIIVCFACTRDEVLDTQYYSCDAAITDQNSSIVGRERFQALIDELTHQGVPGLMMTIQKEDQLAWSGASGFADLNSHVPLQACNITRVGSIVKTFTAVTIMLLQQEGKLQLDDQITKYLSHDQIDGLKNSEFVTIRQLLNHSSGLYNYIVNPKFQTASLNDLKKKWSRDDLLRYAKGMDANFKPGTDVQYSNTNYVLLGDIITAIEQKPFYKVFEEKIFRPQQLNFTRYAAEDPIPFGLIRGYADLYSDLNVINTTYYSGWDYFTADGGLISNPYDLNLFVRKLFANEILSPESMAEMTTWVVPKEQDNDGFDTFYGLGIFKIETSYGRAYMHSGDAIGYYASMIYFPEQKTSVTWATNGNYGSIDQFTQTKEAMERIFFVVMAND